MERVKGGWPLCIIVSWILVIFFFFPLSWAGLRTTFVKVMVRDLMIGKTYNITEINRKPLAVKNTGKGTIALKIEPLRPRPHELDKGYEPIPDISWLKIKQGLFEIKANEEAMTDVIISIPEDECLLGKKYQAFVWSKGIGGSIGVGLKGKVLFSIDNVIKDHETGLKVKPGIYTFTDIPVGKMYELEIPLCIFNDMKHGIKCLLSSAGPFEGGARSKCVHGYSEIPDGNWLYFENDEIEIKADSTARIKMFLRIPLEEKYHNQHWVVIPRISDNSKKSGSIDPALFPKFFIETESKKNIKEKPSGLTGIKPSRIEFHNLPFDIALEIGKFSIYNNDSKPHEYKIAPAANYNGFKKPWLSCSYNWLPDPQWIIINKDAVKIAAGRSQEISLKANVPKRFAYKDWNWEEILLITPDNGPPEFIRVQITTARE